MNNNALLPTILTVGVLTLIVGVGIGYTFGITRYGVPASGMHMMQNGALMQNERMNASMGDQHFIVQMIPHHEGAIVMAELALERSKRPEMLSLARGIIEAQTREITEMTTWYEQWYGSAPPPGGMGMHMDSMSGDMVALRATSDAEFDREFIEQMIPHHEMAVMMAQMIVSSDKPEMRALADAIITSQSREIDMMRSWLTAWYGN